MDVSGSESIFVTGHKTGDIRLWSTNQMKVMHTIEKVHQEKVECCVFSRDEKKIYSVSRDHTIKVTDMQTLKQITAMEHQDLIIPSGGCKFGLSANGKFLAVGGQNGQVFVFNLETHKIEEIYAGEHSAPVLGCQWDPNWGSRLATID